MTAAARPVAGFSGPVRLVQAGDVDWLLAEELTYTSVAGRSYTVAAGTVTDGASVPRPWSWLFPRSGRYLPPAVIHDTAYARWVPAGEMDYREADALLLEGMRVLRVAWLSRLLIWAAVRLAGLFRGPVGRRGWWRDAPKVLGAAVLAAPFVLPAGLLVAVSLAVFFAVEWVAYWVILLGRRVGVVPPDRYVNPPRDLTRA